MYAMLETLTLLAITLNILQYWVNGNLTLEFKVTKISGIYKPAVNCLVGNKTYSHGEIFKLDCKTQCVCENGRHACSSLCPKEQLPAPEDTISCRSPRLVEVPGHCCKMWLCENPTSDVYATCHNSSSSPWTPCSHACGLGISTRFTSTAYGCNQLYNLRLCENRKCPEAISHTIHYDNNNNNNNNNHNNNNNNNIDMETKMLPPLTLNNVKNNKDASNHHNTKNMEHRIRKGHDCRNVQHLGPARIRLGQCVSRKLYRPKLCGRCHDDRKCCVPSVSTTIQVELLCPVNAVDPISYIEQQYKQYQDIHHNPYHHQHYPHQYYHQYHFRTIQLQKGAIKSLPSLWDVHKLEPIDQETLQSHRIQIENKFIAVEWIMKCECHENRSPLQEYCLKNSGNNSESNINRNSHIVDNLKGKKHINNNHNSSNSNSSSSSSSNNNHNNKKKNNNNNYYYYYQKHFDDSNRNADSIKFLMAAFNDHYEKNDNNNNVEMNKKIKYNEMSNQKNQHWYALNSNNSNNSNSINISSKSTILNDVQSDIIPNPILPKRPISQRLHHSKRKKLSFHNNDNNDNKDNVINDDSEQIIKSRRKDYHRLNKRQQTKYQNNEEEEFSLSI